MTPEDCAADFSYADMGICPDCKEHCEFEKTDEDGEPMDEDHPDYDDADLLSNCCGA